MEKLSYKSDVPVVGEYDVFVAGGGSSGVAAAVNAARNGASVCVSEQSAMFGGLGTSGLMTGLMIPKDFCGFGVEILNELRRQGGCNYRPDKSAYFLVPYQVEFMKRIYDDIMAESGAAIYLYTKIIGVVMKGGVVEYAVLAGPEGNFAVKAKIFIDATGDAVLSGYAGVKTVTGDEQGQTQAPTMVAYYANVDMEKRNAFFREHGGDEVKVVHMYIPQAVADGVITIEDYHHPGAFFVSNNMAVVNAGHVYGADCSTSRGLTTATVTGRKMALEYFNFYKKYIGGFENAIFVTTGSWLGIRETRRIIGRYVVNYEDQRCYRKFGDAVCRFPGGSGSDIHASSADGEAYKQYYKLFTERDDYKSGDWFDFPYRSLLPVGVENLLVTGRCASADRRVNGQLRNMGTCLMMGQAAGTAAALCAKDGVYTGDVDMAKLQKVLADAGLPNR